MSTYDAGTSLPEPHSSILTAYFSSGTSLDKIAAQHDLSLIDLVNLLQSEPLASALAQVEEEIRRRNYYVYAVKAIEALASIVATCPDPVERRRAAAEILRFLRPLCKVTKENASVVILSRPFAQHAG